MIFFKLQLRTLLIILVVNAPLSAIAQPSADDSLKAEAYFDFWIGNWNLTWKDTDGTTATGTNQVKKILNGKVIEENFEALTGALEGYAGKSYSVYLPRTNEWKQTWIDNSGGYLDFIGKMDGGKRIFLRKGKNPQGQEILQRMVFYDITENSFSWDWEASEDNGLNWQLRWRIYYERAQE